MTQWILTSCILIVVVLLIRAIGRDKLSARLRYALWGLVLLRLLCPANFGESVLSVQRYLPDSGAELISAVAAERVQISNSNPIVIPAEAYEGTVPGTTTETTETIQTTETTQSDEAIEMTASAVQQVAYQNNKFAGILTMLWMTGMVIVGGMFFVSNVRFFLHLRRSRRLVLQENVPVYVTDAVETPCLFGFPRAAVYVTPEVSEEYVAFRHVLAHELTHYRHMDHIWSMLRCICVTLHWYNPLVWAAAGLSQKDAELACDEGTLLQLGEQERTGYAKTLVDLTCVGYKGMLTAATSMAGSESDLKTRVLRIVKNPKMTVSACSLAAVLVLVIALAIFTDTADPLRGTWYGAREEYTSYPATRSLITTQVVFRDGKVRITQFENDRFETSMIFGYTVKGNVLHLERLDHAYEDSYRFTRLDENSIDLGTVSQSGNHIWTGLLTKGDPKETVLTDDPLMEVTAFVDLTREGTWEVCGELSWLEGPIVDMLLRADITAERPMPDPLTYTDYCYGITAKENGKTVDMVFSDGWLYRDGNGYCLANTEAFMEHLSEVSWEPVGGYTDEYGNSYSRTITSDLRLELRTEHGYWDDRRYALDNEQQWSRAWKDAAAHSVVGGYQGEKIVMYLSGLGDAFLNIWSDGTISYFDWVENDLGLMNHKEHYIRPEDASKLMELLKPYLEMAADSEERGAAQQNVNGSWILESCGDPRVTQLQMTVAVGRRYIPSDQTGAVIATVDGCVVETAFDVYAAEDVFHVRWRDCREEAIPCKVDGDTLTLYAESGTWTFRKGSLDSVTEENTDIIRFNKSGSKNVRLELTDEKLNALYGLILEGMEPIDSNIIYTDVYFYKLIGAEEAFGADNITLSDLGTLHFNGKSYELTNWAEIEALLDTLYRVVY